MDVVNQYEHLKTFKLLPIRLRYFQNFVFFTFNLFKENHAGTLLDSFRSHKKTRTLRNDSIYHVPKFNTSLYEFSFISIAIKLLNSFIASNLWLIDLSFRNMFNGNDSILFFYLRSAKFWT